MRSDVLRWFGALVFLAVLGGIPLAAQGTVSRAEFNALKSKYKTLQQSFEQFKKQQANVVTKQVLDERLETAVDEALEGLHNDITLNSAARPGTTNFIITGYGTANFSDSDSGNSSFGATFNPIFLWRLANHLAFEAEIELELDGVDTGVALEYAQILWTPVDWLTIGAGRFLNPFGLFRERLHPSWINKLPDQPLGYKGGATRLVPGEQVGVEARGAVLLGHDMALNYVVYVSNGPDLITMSPASFGQLTYENVTDTNNNKAIGGRIGFLPIPEIEVGYSFEYSQVNPNGSAVKDVNVLLQEIDFSLHSEQSWLAGTADVRFEYINSDVDNVFYDPTGSIGFGPATFNNERDAWYVQVAYRPTLADSDVLKRFELVARYDEIDQPRGAPGGITDEQRLTVGLNYWFGPSSVLKVAYRFDNRDNSKDDDAFMVQWALAF